MAAESASYSRMTRRMAAESASSSRKIGVWRRQERDDGSVVENNRFYAKMLESIPDFLLEIRIVYRK